MVRDCRPGAMPGGNMGGYAMADEKDVNILKQGATAWNAWRRNELAAQGLVSEGAIRMRLEQRGFPFPDLRGVDLSGAYLPYVMGPLHTIVDVMADLRLGRTRVYDLMKAGDLVAVKLGQGTRITDESLQDFKESLQPVQL
jgi:hypothetical protein